MTKFVKAAHAANRGKGVCAFLVAAALSLTLILGGCSSDAAGEDPAGQEAGQASISVTVSVTADAEGFEPQELAVDVAQGATVYDALVASGIEITASDSEYGKFVEAIGGLAGDASHGWVYTVNGEEVMEGSDSCVLAAGDAVEWTYISW